MAEATENLNIGDKVTLSEFPDRTWEVMYSNGHKACVEDPYGIELWVPLHKLTKIEED